MWSENLWRDEYFYQPHEEDHPWFEHHENGDALVTDINRDRIMIYGKCVRFIPQRINWTPITEVEGY